MRDYYEYHALGLLAVVDCDHRYNDITANVKGIYLKARLNEERPNSCYVYGAPIHLYDERDTADGYLEQARVIYEMGCDGFKSLDGKPTQRKPLGRPLCDPVYDKMYGYLEEVGLPAKMHVCDPRKYWGAKETLPRTAIERGWWYGDGTYPSFEEIHGEVRSLMEKFPRLRLCMAHMGYLTDAPDEWVQFLEKYPGTSYDLTPGAAEFLSFTKDPDLWREYLNKYSKRIFFGTDTYNQIEPEDVASNSMEKTSARHDQVRRALEGKPGDTFEVPSIGAIINPLGLDRETLENIYSVGFREQHGEPRKISARAVLCEVERSRARLLSGVFNIPKDEIKPELENLDVIEKYFLSVK
jgi:predicted TIM-barrel fold metal-dependent hydrolase